MTITEAPPLHLRQPGSGRRLILPSLAAALVAAADFLLFDQPAGLGWLVFLGLLALAVATSNGRVKGTRLVAISAIPALALLPLAENVSPLSVIVALTGLAAFALAMRRQLRSRLAGIARQLLGFFLLAPFRLLADVIRSRTLHKRLGRRGTILAHVLVWTIPVVFGAAFILLFGIANPIIEQWLLKIDIWAFLARIDIWRVLFWAFIAGGVWAYLRPWLPKRRNRKARLIAAIAPNGVPALPSTLSTVLFGRAALLRALLVFNAIFAVQTALDAAYLWGGVALPDGLTYAAYAHRGAYALIATALLAAAFVLAAMRPGSQTSGDRLIRTLVYLWTAQNIWLVLSSILRLDLYVDVYSLTYWRIAAFLWMVLVAAGLALIIARIALARSNQWLMSANLATLVAMLYACCFINFAALIANYNVDHSLEISGKGLAIDQLYLGELGPAAFPAIDRLLQTTAIGADCYANRINESYPRCLMEVRGEAQAHFEARLQNWRAWSFRNWRLMRYLEGRAPVAPEWPARPGTAQ